ncbi:MAG: hypothetical protein N2Z57_04015, partial [Oscillospiraceae bacterium]|nr:hypothetical protein [Oscillospiraceae bacterium]
NEKEPYANHSNLLKIYVNKNSIGIYVNAVTAKSEQEVLLFPKGFFRLICPSCLPERNTGVILKKE